MDRAQWVGAAPIVWQAAGVRSCFEHLALMLMDDLASVEWRPLFDHHRERIAEYFDSQPGLLADQDVYAGFLHGFLTTGTHFVPDGSVQQQAMFPALGGILLLGLAAEAASPPVRWAREFLGRLGVQLDRDPMETALSDKELTVMQRLVRTAFAATPDVPMTATSLAGFVLGVLYTMPYLDISGASGPVMLLAAVRHMAEHLDGGQ
jgi:hypothetical protein